MSRAHQASVKPAAPSTARPSSLASPSATRSPAELVRSSLSSTGRPLEPDVRAFLEPRLGHSLSQVRIHDDARSAESADAVEARAYTIGRNIVFGPGEYAPRTAEGRRLLVHELTHVGQQAAGPVHGTATADGLEMSDPSDGFERDARRLADLALPDGAGATASRPGRPDRPIMAAGSTPGDARLSIQRDRHRRRKPAKPVTRMTVSGSLTLPSRDIVTWRVDLQGAPSTMLPQNQRDIKVECQAGISAAVKAVEKTRPMSPGPRSLDLRVDVQAARLLMRGYVARLVETAATAELRSQPAQPTAPPPAPATPAPTIDTSNLVLVELASAAKATFVDPLAAELPNVMDERAAQQLILSIVPALRAASVKLIEEADAKKLQKPRAFFRRRHADLGKQALDNIDRALEQIASGNVQLRVAFYRYYADADLTDELDPASTNLGQTDSGDTELRRDVLHLETSADVTQDPLGLLGGTLIHEFVHTAQRGLQPHPRGEAKAYGIEYVLVERSGRDPKRLAIIEGETQDSDSFKQGMGVHRLFLETRRVMEALYAVIDGTTGPRTPTQARLSRDDARALVVQFVTTDEGRYGKTLRDLMKEVTR